MKQARIWCNLSPEQVEILAKASKPIEKTDEFTELLGGTAWCAGDPSVGIFATNSVFVIEKWLLNDDQREYVRTALKDFFSESFDDQARVWFDDECAECGQLLTVCRCEEEERIMEEAERRTEELANRESEPLFDTREEAQGLR
jgi:hypothetical protein